MSNKHLDWIGENEVFETTFTSNVYADTLNGKCKIWDIEAYDGQTGLGINDYYTRANYNFDKVNKYI